MSDELEAYLIGLVERGIRFARVFVPIAVMITLGFGYDEVAADPWRVLFVAVGSALVQALTGAKPRSPEARPR